MTDKAEIANLHANLAGLVESLEHLERRLNNLVDEVSRQRRQGQDGLRDLEYDISDLKRSVSNLERESR